MGIHTHTQASPHTRPHYHPTHPSSPYTPIHSPLLSVYSPYPCLSPQATQQCCMNHSDTSINIGVVYLWNTLLVSSTHQVLLYGAYVSEILDISVVCVFWGGGGGRGVWHARERLGMDCVCARVCVQTLLYNTGHTNTHIHTPTHTPLHHPTHILLGSSVIYFALTANRSLCLSSLLICIKNGTMLGCLGMS